MNTLSAVRKAKAAGFSAAETWTILRDSIDAAAKADGWRPSEHAATITDAQEDVVKIYGTRATKAVFPNRWPS